MAKPGRYPILYMLPSVILIPIVAVAIAAISLMQLDLGVRWLMDGIVVFAAFLILGGLYWWGGKGK